MTPIVLVGPGNDVEHAHRVMAAQRPGLIFCRPEEACAQQAQVAVCWSPPPGSLGALPSLRLIHSVGAGADRILAEPSRPPGVPVCRIVDPDHRQGMMEYVLWGVLHHHRRMDRTLANQPRQHWERLPQQPAQRTHVGVMGLGTLGGAVARHLALLGFATRGWARRTQPIDGVTTFQADEFDTFLRGLDTLVCLLPLTDSTRGILCAATFDALAPGATVINCGRGDHLVEDDLIDALARGQLQAALLDVFTQEPLPSGHRLWHQPGVTVTPHIASSASHEVIAAQILENVDRLWSGRTLLNRVDTERGY